MKTPRRLSPRERKEAAYERDHPAPSAHGLRRSWKKHKRVPVRAERHEATTKTAAIAKLSADTGALEAHDLNVHARQRPRKDFVHSLRQKVKAQTQARIEHIGQDLYFSCRYDTETHRVPFSAFLTSICRGRSVRSRQLAIYFHNVLQAAPSRSGSRSACTARFLRAFAVDEPLVFGRFMAWLGRLTGPGASA